MSIIFTILVLLGIAINVVWAVFMRKLVKSRIRGICTLASFLIALIAALAFSGTATDPVFINETVMPMLQSYIPDNAQALLTASPALYQVAFGMASALITPMLFVIFYILTSLLGWIVYGIIVLVHNSKMKREENTSKKKPAPVPYATARSIIWGVVSVAVTIVVIFVPVSVYGRLAVDITDAAVEADVLGAYGEQVDSLTAKYVKPVVENPLVEIFRVFGGDALTDEMTSFTVGEKTAYLDDEIHTFISMGCKVMPLAKVKPADYGADEAAILESLADDFAKSNILSTIAAELTKAATDAWIAGDDFMGISADEFTSVADGMFADFINRTIRILNTDSQKPAVLCADIKTLAQMAGDLIESGAFAKLGDTEGMAKALVEGDTVKNVIVDLGNNNSLKVLIPEVANIGIEAIGTYMKVENDADALYEDLMAAIANDLNNVGDAETAADDLAANLRKTLDKAGIVIDKQTSKTYADALMSSLVEGANAEITADDVKKFFATYSECTALQSAETLREETVLVFLDDLLIDVDEAAAKINENTVEDEAEAIAAIFKTAGKLVKEFSSEKVDIEKTAGSIGSILNSLDSSVSFGKKRTSDLFVAILQSSMVREAVGFDIATATELGKKGSEGETVDYEKTFQTVSNAMDMMQNMNDGKLEQGDIEDLLENITPETAGMIESFITEERLTEDYGMNKEQSELAAPLISDVFVYLGDADLTEEQRKNEAAAINDVMNLVTNASDRANSSEAPAESLFGEEGENSVLGKTADQTIQTIMASGAIKEALNNNPEKLENGGLFGQKGEEGEEEVTQTTLSEAEKGELLGAMERYYTETEFSSEDAKKKDAEALANIGKLFGLSNDDMSFLPDVNNNN